MTPQRPFLTRNYNADKQYASVQDPPEGRAMALLYSKPTARFNK